MYDSNCWHPRPDLDHRLVSLLSQLDPCYFLLAGNLKRVWLFKILCYFDNFGTEYPFNPHSCHIICFVFASHTFRFSHAPKLNKWSELVFFDKIKDFFHTIIARWVTKFSTHNEQQDHAQWGNTNFWRERTLILCHLDFASQILPFALLELGPGL